MYVCAELCTYKHIWEVHVAYIVQFTGTLTYAYIPVKFGHYSQFLSVSRSHTVTHTHTHTHTRDKDYVCV